MFRTNKLAAAITAGALAMTLAGCGGGSDADRTEVENTVRSTTQALSAGNVAGLADLMTDRALLEEFEASRAEFVAMPGDAFAFPVAVHSFGRTDVDGDTATSEVIVSLNDSWLSGVKLHLAKENGTWKIDRAFESDRYDFSLPGITPIEVEMKEFAYIYDPADFSGDIRAFELRNTGSQEHEAALLRVTRQGTTAEIVDVALNTEGDELPEGFEFVAAASALPGETTDLVLKDTLAPGRYLFMCFFEDETDAGHNHLEKGMVADFTVSG
jgi:hypothetical protein